MESKAPISHPDEWPVVSLKNICGKIGSGATPKGGKSSYLLERENYAFVRSQNVFDRYFSFDGLAYISDDQAEKLRNVELKPGDILLNITGDGVTFARACMVPMHVLPACVNQHVAIIRLDEEVADPGYVLSFLTLPAVKIYIESFNAGGSRRAITKGHIESFQLPLPPIDVQRYIAQVLQSLDDKIELNRQINATLESMAQALFKSWFVDFDPVIDNALAAGNTIPEPLQARAEKRAALLAAASAADTRSASATDNAHPTQTAPHAQPGTTAPATPLQPLPADLRTLFPDSFVFNEEMGWVPEGWDILPFGELLDVTIGGDWGKEETDDKHTKPVAIIRGTDIPSVKAGIKGSIPHRWVEEKKFKSRQLLDGDIVIEVSGGSPKQPTGRACYVTDDSLAMLNENVVAASFCRKFRPTSKEIGLMAALHLDFIYAQGKMWGYQNQSTGISNFQTKVFLETEMVLMPKNMKIAEKFFSFVRPMIDRCRSPESEQLAEIRDALLPKLLSGQIKLPEAEKLAAEAL